MLKITAYDLRKKSSTEMQLVKDRTFKYEGDSILDKPYKVADAIKDIFDVDEMLEKTLLGLKEAEILHDEKLISLHSVVMNPAYVHVSKSGMEEVARQKAALAEHDVYSIGRYGSWNYSSIEDNMKEAIKLSNILQ